MTIGVLIIAIILIIPTIIGLCLFLRKIKEPFITLFFVMFIILPLLVALISMIGASQV